jgi:hypothetical protein
MVILFLNNIPKRTPSGYDSRHYGFLHGLLLIVCLPPILNMGDDLKEKKGDIFSIGKIMDTKIPFKEIQPNLEHIHLSNLQIQEYQN